MWQSESYHLAPVTQTLHGCRAALRREWWPNRPTPPELEWWQPDLAELKALLVSHIVPRAVSQPTPKGSGFTCGVDLRCGTQGGYNRGGRCHWCTRARRYWLANRPAFHCDTDPRCGIYAGYVAGGRCHRCLAAHRAYRKEWCARVHAKFQCDVDPRCGTLAGYSAGGKCDQCRLIHNVVRARNRKLAAAKFQCDIDPRCGTYNGYAAGGKCQACKTAHTIKRKAYLRAAKARAG